MPILKVNLVGQPLLDIASYARRGLERRDRLTPTEIAHISRTVRRVPEAVVKVLSKDSNKFTSIGRHLNYIGRRGELELEMDDGDQIKSKNVGGQFMEGWDLDLDEHRRQSDLASAGGRAPPKLVHKLMLSMPPGSPPQGVLAAARSFLREEFAFKHRYAFVLH
ncbi:MAG: relaxase/mobilization nuclease domain-containing protein, partial [Steroidobacteraceae bacterium]